MKRLTMTAALAALIVMVRCAPGACGAVADPASAENSADYAAVCPDALCGALAPLLALRESQGLKPAVVRLADVYRAFPAASHAESVRDFVHHAYRNWRAPRLKYLLLVGDSAAVGGGDESLLVPNHYLEAEPRSYVRKESEKLASDHHYSLMDDDELPDVAVGRIPADDADELKAVVAKIVDYESSGAVGEWRKKASFFASEGHFGALDKSLEKMAKNMVRHNVLPIFDLSMTYANPNLPYFYPADEFNDKVVERFNERPLFMIYIGHGRPEGFDDVWFDGKRHPIMQKEDVPRVKAGDGRYPIVFIIACSTGHFDSPEFDSIGEMLIKSPGGPVGVLASSRVSDPYGNSVLSREIARALLQGLEPRIGDAVVKAKRGMVENLDADRRYIDKFASLFIRKSEMETAIREHLYLYNYLGDPATLVQFPRGRVEAEAPATAAPGERLEIAGRVVGMTTGRAAVTFECEPVTTAHPVEPLEGLDDTAYRAAVRRNYANANDKVVARAEVPVADGKLKAALDVPQSIPGGVYHVKVFAWNEETEAAGYAEVRLGGGAP
ncbi:MAG: C25 family cysteine peptidase [bacterium]